MDTAEILEGLERCPRIPFWGRDWEKNRLTPSELLDLGLRAGLMEPPGYEYGLSAGEEVFSLAATHQIASKEHDLHAQVVHLANLIHLVTAAIRKPDEEAWKTVDSLPDWESSCYLSPDGNHLRKVVFVTSWNDDRHYSLCRSWSVMGEVCQYGLPMQLVVVMLGKQQGGRYHSFWTHGLRHPVNKKIRFRKKLAIAEGFKSSWVEAWRENHDEITTEEWLNAMISDDVIRDVLFKIDVAVPEKSERKRINELAAAKLDRLSKMKSLPLQNLSTCDWPSPCDHRRHCHAGDEPSGRYGFVQIS